jgi:signal transduction histidine kinase
MISTGSPAAGRTSRQGLAPASCLIVADAWSRLKITLLSLGCSAEQPRGWIASWRLAPELSSVRRARRLTRDRLAIWRLDGFRDVAELLVGELVTNALRHAPGPCRLTLSAVDGLLRCEVEDSGADLPRLRETHEFDENGRGLNLVDMLACCWGWARTPAGKVVWFELPIGS